MYKKHFPLCFQSLKCSRKFSLSCALHHVYISVVLLSFHFMLMTCWDIQCYIAYHSDSQAHLIWCRISTTGHSPWWVFRVISRFKYSCLQFGTKHKCPKCHSMVWCAVDKGWSWDLLSRLQAGQCHWHPLTLPRKSQAILS